MIWCLSHVVLLPFSVWGFSMVLCFCWGIFRTLYYHPLHFPLILTHGFWHVFVSLAVTEVCVLTNDEYMGRVCHQVFSRRFLTQWDKQCPPVCPSCGCLSRLLFTGWWATELMAMKDKVPAVTTKVTAPDHFNCSSIYDFYHISLLCKILLHLSRNTPCALFN